MQPTSLDRVYRFGVYYTLIFFLFISGALVLTAPIHYNLPPHLHLKDALQVVSVFKYHLQSHSIVWSPPMYSSGLKSPPIRGTSVKKPSRRGDLCKSGCLRRIHTFLPLPPPLCRPLISLLVSPRLGGFLFHRWISGRSFLENLNRKIGI